MVEGAMGDGATHKPPKEEALEFCDELYRYMVDVALENGKVIKFEKRTEGENGRDLVVEIVVRHNKYIKPEEV